MLREDDPSIRENSKIFRLIISPSTEAHFNKNCSSRLRVSNIFNIITGNERNHMSFKCSNC